MKEIGKKFILTAALTAAFAVFTVLVRYVDVKPIGPEMSDVGFAAVNGYVHGLTGVHMALYTLTDIMSIIPVAIMLGAAAVGAVQLIKRKSLFKVDAEILLLGGFYAVLAAVYVLFELAAVNYRPVLIAGRLEASYPSSTTVLVTCVMLTAAMLVKRRSTGSKRRCILGAVYVYTVFMVGSRLISGVHWLTDIVGGLLVSAELIALYSAALSLVDRMRRKK